MEKESLWGLSPLLLSMNWSQKSRILSSKDPWTTMWLLLYKFILLLSLYEKIFVKSWQNSAWNLPGRTPIIPVAVQQMGQQRICHGVCYSTIDICCVQGHIWNRHRCPQPCPREALTPCQGDSATFLNDLVVVGGFKIEILSAAFYAKWWKAAKKHYWDIFLLALWDWAFITVNKLWYLSVVSWGISYTAAGRLTAITYAHVLPQKLPYFPRRLDLRRALRFPRDGGPSSLLLMVSEAALPWHGAHRFVLISLGGWSLAPAACTV